MADEGPHRCLLHCEVQGDQDGPTLLFLHGFMGSSSDWAETVEQLPRFHCIAPDLPGHGRTPPSASPDPYSMAGAGRALLALLDELGVQMFTPIGYSMGGRLALYLALEYPDRCRQLVVESSSPGLATAQERERRRQWDEDRAVELETWEFSRFLTMWYRQPLFESLVRNQERFLPLLERRRQNDPLELARSMRAMGTGAQPSLWPALERLSPPFLALCGALDAKYRKTMKDMVRVCKDGRYRVVAGAGHNVHCEAPKVFVQVLRDFLVR